MSEPLQFDRAEDDVAKGPSVQSCVGCKSAIVDRYFTVQGKIVCAACHARVLASIGERFGQGGFAKALLGGTGAALLGAAIFYGVAAIVGVHWGPISVLVGYMVGKAVAKGANSKGGLGYQALAVALTYLAVALTFLPEILKTIAERPSHDAYQVIGSIITVLIGPIVGAYFSPLSGLINGFALWEAWKLNRTPQLTITGPHVVNTPPHVG